MAQEILKQFIPDQPTMQKWQEQGVQFWLAHPDDELLVGWKAIKEFVAAGIPITVILMTLGENGKYFGQEMEPGQLMVNRHEEFMNSLSAFSSDQNKINQKIFGYPDSELENHEEELKKEAIIYIRETNPAAVFTFSQEDMNLWDHLDHKTTGKIASWASEKSDMPRIHSNMPPVPDIERPSLFYFTQDQDHTHIEIKLTDEDQKERVRFAKEIYPSQFGNISDEVLFEYFEQVSTGDNNSLTRAQRFRKVR